MIRKNRATAIAFAVVLVFVGYSVGVHNGKKEAMSSLPPLVGMNDGKPGSVDFSTFWKAWNILQDKFVSTSSTTGQTTDQDKVWGAIQGLAASYKDPYTVFFPPVQAEIFNDDVRGNFDGVGMEVGMKDNALVVIAPLKNSPAERAGIKAGDIVIKIDGKSIAGFTTEQAIALIRGKKGTPVVLTVARVGEKNPLDLTAIRDTIEIPTIRTELLPSGVFDIQLYSFSSNSPELFRQALRSFIQAHTDKLLLDLRGNPGGYLDAAIDMASWFLPLGKTVVIEDFGGKQQSITYRSKGYDVFNDRLKMVILIDGGSASASEILSGALSQQNVAVLVGQKSFGKGSVQELVDITPDTSLKVTIARWLTPNGTSISAQGVKPDFEVSLDADQFKKTGVDAQRQKAESVLLDDDFWAARKAKQAQ